MKHAPLRTASPHVRGWLGALVGVSAVLAMYMSWGALHELAAEAGGMPLDRSAVFPLVVDLPAVGALLIVIFVPAPTRWLRVLPWITSTVFAGVTILGNMAAVRLIDPATLALGPEVAIAIGSVPPIAFLLLAHLAAVTVYRVDDTRTTRTKQRTAKTEQPVAAPEPAPVRTAAPRTAPTRTSPDELAERTAQRDAVLALVRGGTPVRTAARLAYTAPSNAQRWVDQARRDGTLTSQPTPNEEQTA